MTGESLPDDYRVFWMPSATGIHRPTYLLLHGIGLSHRSFTRAARLLARHGAVLAIDLPGFGGTRTPRRGISVEEYAAGIAAVLDRRGIGPVVAVGHSMGAQFALALALARPDLVQSVVMIGPVVDGHRRTVWAQAFGLARDAALEPPRTNLMVSFDYARCGMPWFLTETRAMMAYPTHERIHDLTKPLLVLRGRHDPIAKLRWATWLADQVEHGTVAEVPGFRHNAVHSAPVAAAQQIIRFVDSTPG